jgi:RHS repeat-associated protein
MARTAATASDIAGTGAPTLDSQRNTFDTYDRLTKTCFTTTTCTTANQTVWTYDKVGNRLTEKIGAAAVSTSTYDTADQMTTITGPGTATYTYSPNGDQLTAGTDTYGYNTARQPVSATIAGVPSTFTYDGNNNRTQITTAGTATAETIDTNNPLPLVVTEKKAGAAVRTYSYAPGGTVLRYNDVTAATSGWYLSDALGSVTEIVNPTGGTVATYRYNPFGTTRATTLVSAGYTNNPLKYTGQQQDPTGNYNLRARHYNPATGRFTQTDPMPYGAGSAFESAYAYALNNPLMYTDPSGLRGGLPGCPWSKNPIGSQQPELLALRTQILIPVPGTLPPRTVPPRTLPPRSPTTRVPATTRPSTTTTIDEPDPTEVTTSTRPGQTCTNERHDELKKLMKAACSRKFSCSDTAERKGEFKCPQLLSNIATGRGCIAARQRVQDECFAGSPEPDHEAQIAQLQGAVDVCLRKARERKCLR